MVAMETSSHVDSGMSYQIAKSRQATTVKLKVSPGCLKLKQNFLQIRLLGRCELNLWSFVIFSDQFQSSGFMKW